MKKLEILTTLEYLDKHGGDTVTVGVDSLRQLLAQILNFETRVQDGAILKVDDGYVILVKYFEACGSGPLPLVGYLTQDSGKFYLDRLMDEYLEVQPELAGEPLASPTRCAEYILSSKRRLRGFLKWLEKEKVSEVINGD